MNTLIRLLVNHSGQVLNTFISLLRVIWLSKPRSNKSSAIQKRLLVMGNGPSLNSVLAENPKLLQSGNLLCVNGFALSEQYELLKPEDYVLLDPAYFDDSDSRLPVVDEILKAIQNKTAWPIRLHVPWAARKSPSFQFLLSECRQIKPVYFNYVIAEGYSAIVHRLYDWGLAMPRCQNVLGVCIMLGIKLGFSEILLLGADHSWHELLRMNDQNELTLDLEHYFFFEGKPGKEVNMNKLVNKREYNISSFFYSLAKTFKGYHHIQDYALKRNVQVWNASKKSYIDAFPKFKDWNPVVTVQQA